MKNTIDPTRPVELEDGTPCRITASPTGNSDRITVSYVGSGIRGVTLTERSTVWYYLSTGHWGGSEGSTRYLRLRNVGGRVRPYDQWRMKDQFGGPRAPAQPALAPIEYRSNFSPKWNSHGGGCCGVSHIYNFNNTPTNYAGPDSYLPTHNPAHTGAKQFELCLQNIRRSRSSGMIEIVLLDYQDRNWKKIVTEAGFEKVGTFINSNTSHRLNVYHYYYGPSNEKKVTIKGLVANPFKGKF